LGIPAVAAEELRGLERAERQATAAVQVEAVGPGRQGRQARAEAAVALVV
jgi:hypothetical protein